MTRIDYKYLADDGTDDADDVRHIAAEWLAYAIVLMVSGGTFALAVLDWSVRF